MRPDPGELTKLGIRVSAPSVRRVLRRHERGTAPRGGPSWAEFLRAQAAGIVTRGSPKSPGTGWATTLPRDHSRVKGWNSVK